MFRKNYLTSFLTIALFLVGGLSAAAQTTGSVGGRVVLKGADGKSTPVEGAAVEAHRTDIKQKLQAVKTNKNGDFTIAGVPVGAVIALAVSAPGASPDVVSNIKAGMEGFSIELSAGDGKKFTDDEVRQIIERFNKSSQSGQVSADQKKQQEEYEKKAAEIAAKNKQIESQTAAVKRALEEGNAAFNSKNYDVAVVKYEEGFQANPDFVGSAPVLLNNKGQALRQRAVILYNENSKSTDAAAKAAGMGKVRQDLADAAEAYNKSWTIIKNAPAADINDPKTHELNKINALTGAKDTFRLMALTRSVDTTKSEMAKTLISEYVAMESDQSKKTEAQRILGDIFLAAGDSENAIVEYKKVLEINANDPDALAGIGLSLVTIGYTNDDKTKFQEAADYLQKFVEVAPANHKLLASVKESIADLKNTQNIAPQKGGGKTTTTKKKN